MRRPRKTCKRQRGVAVVTALLLTTLAITIVASLFWQQQVQVRSIENQRLQLQKQWILRGALDWASLILRADKNASGEPDHLGEPWAVPLAETRLDQYVENGRTDADASDASISGNIIDAYSRYNLSNLAVNGEVQPAEVAVFRTLLSLLQVNPALAKVTADTIAAAQPKAAPQPGSVPPGGAQQVVETQSGARPMKIEFIDDLLVVPGFTPEIVEKLKNYVIVLPKSPSPTNLNTAPAEVLAARLKISLADAAQFVASRDHAHLLNPIEVGNRLPGLEPDASHASIFTDYFLVNGKVRMNRAGLSVQALVQREGATTRLIWIREN